MTGDLVDQAINLMRAQRFSDALHSLRQAMQQDPANWNILYMAGQCCRFLNDLHGATSYLNKAVAVKPDEPSLLLALGIALQLKGSFSNAIEAFRKALEIDPDYVLAYNSLALTQKKMGDCEVALHNYGEGIKALSREIARGMVNLRDSEIFKHLSLPHTLWLEYAMLAAVYLCSLDQDVETCAWPTGEQAIEEERTERHAGLYWVDQRNVDGKNVRLFLPNYFNTFRERLRADRTYSNLIGNRGTVLELLGQHAEARRHFQEAEAFAQPRFGLDN